MGYNSIHNLCFLLPNMAKKEASAGQLTAPPKGCLAVKVGLDDLEQQKFVIPVIYLYHPLFLNLLKEAEEEYGFDHEGVITIPCPIEYFHQVQGIINRDTSGSSSLHGHHPHFLTCFRA